MSLKGNSLASMYLSDYTLGPYFKVRNNEGVDSYSLLKKGVWAYILLLFFEGALRKWVFPGLATPLLVVRDPLALWLVLLTWKRGLLPANMYLTGMVLIGVVGLFSAVFLGHGNLPVALYGARILLIHFPLFFVIGRVFDREDVITVGKAVLLMSIPMVILIAFQFYSPQSAWVNRGVGGDIDGAGFTGALGYFRPPGTFSFTNGNAYFFGFVAPFVFYFWLDRKPVKSWALIAATVALVLSIPLSISRTLLFMTVISSLYALVAILRKPEHLGKMLIAIVGGVVALLILSQTSLFGTAAEAFTTRFDSANKAEGGLEGVFLDRFLGGLIGAFTKNADLPFWGYGLGMGTNVGSKLLYGNTVFLISEEEWGRVIGELGPLLGASIIFLRIGLTIKIVKVCYSKLTKGDLLPWMLLSYGLLNISGGGWAQPTSLGFSILITGLIIASLRQKPI